MCVSRCLHCVGLSLIPMAIVCMLCNILLLVPGLKIDFLLENHVTREATWATGLWGSGFVVRLCVSMTEGCFAFGFVLFFTSLFYEMSEVQTFKHLIHK